VPWLCQVFLGASPGMSGGAFDAATTGKARSHRRILSTRLRRGLVGWKSNRAIQRLAEATAEARLTIRQYPVRAAEGTGRLI
jgi:hypothetical protein